MSLELDAAITCAHLALPASFWWHNTNLFVLIVTEHTTCLPPFIVGGIGHMQDVAVLKGQAAWRQTIIAIRIIVKERAYIERSLLCGSQQCAGSACAKRRLLFQLLNACLKTIVVLGPILCNQCNNATGCLNAKRRELYNRDDLRSVRSI